MGTASFPGIKQLGRGFAHPPHLASRLKKAWSCTSTPPPGLRGVLYDELYLFLYLYDLIVTELNHEGRQTDSKTGRLIPFILLPIKMSLIRHGTGRFPWSLSSFNSGLCRLSD